MGNSIKVGAFVIAFAGMIFAAYSVLGRQLFAPKKSTFYASFKDAAGLNPGSRILMAGVNVGTVSKISLVSPTEAKLTLEVDPELKIPSGSIAELPTSLTGFGEQVLLLVPPKIPTSGLIRAGATLVGRKQKALDSILPNGEDAVTEMTRTMAAFRKILEDKSLLNELKGLMSETKNTAKSFGQTAGSVNGLIADNRRNFQVLLASATKSMENVEALTNELGKAAKSGKMMGNLEATLENIKKASEQGNELIAEMKKLVSDPEMQASLKSSTANLKLMSDSGVKMAANGEVIAKNVEKMSQDGPEISKKISELMTKANEIATKISDIADDVKGAVGKVTKTLTEGAPSPFKGVETRFDLIQETKPSFIRTDFTAIFPQSNGDSFQLGMFNAFESNQLIAQYGRQLNDRTSLRYGIFASKPGVGVDYSIGPSTLVRADVFSLNDPRFDLRIRQDFGKGFFGWAGVNRVFGENVPMFGFGIKR